VTRTVLNVIDGRSVAARSGRTTDVLNPATGQVCATAPLSGPEDVDDAFAAAARAFGTWRDSTPAERQRALLRIAEAIEARAEEFVAVESENTG
jgi:betaine-aldehyde dehydrogenase